MQEEEVTDLVCWAPLSFALLCSCYSANSFFSFCSVCVCLSLRFLLCFFFVLLPCFLCWFALFFSWSHPPSLFSSSFVCVCSLCLLGFLLAFVFLYALCTGFFLLGFFPLSCSLFSGFSSPFQSKKSPIEVAFYPAFIRPEADRRCNDRQ